MEEVNPIYAAIDLKSFYASVECVERQLDPLTTNLVVADFSRTEKTICLAVSPSLKAYGIPGRARLFEVIQKVGEINKQRLTAIRKQADGQTAFAGKSFDVEALAADSRLELDYITAVPQMAHYMDMSAKIYGIYLKYISPEDIHVYSIDEVFIYLTPYLKCYHMTAEELARTIIRDVFDTTGITATAGIGTNLYLCKVAMDIVAKHKQPDEYGVRLAFLDEMGYRQQLWSHTPITDFWRVGNGYARKLMAHGLYTMGDIARCSVGAPDDYYNEDLLYRLFGINAELLIDHAWGWEPCTIAEIKKYHAVSSSISSGQVLHTAYSAEKARLIVYEMTDQLALDLTRKGLLTKQITLTIGYDSENLKRKEFLSTYAGTVVSDHYGRLMPRHGHASRQLPYWSASAKGITREMLRLYDSIIDPRLTVRRIRITFDQLMHSESDNLAQDYEQLSLFSTAAPSAEAEQKKQQEQQCQTVIVDIRHKFGKNAILKGANLQEGATAIERNSQIGGHRA